MDNNIVFHTFNIDNLKNENIKNVYKRRLKEELSKINTLCSSYDEIIAAIRLVACETLGEEANSPTTLNQRSEIDACISPYIQGDSNIYVDISQDDLDKMPKAGDWVAYYKQLFTANKQESIMYSTNTTNNDSIEITLELLQDALKTRKDGKVAGPGNLPIELIKNGPTELTDLIAKLFTKCINEQCIPEEWKTAYIIPAFKKGDLQLPENYRPISVPSTFSRLYGRILLQELRKDYKEAEEQAAYRADRTSIDHLYVLKELCKKRLSTKKEVHLVFVDIAKAFDSVPWAGLFKAVEWAGIRPSVISAIKTLYQGSTSYVYVHQTGTLSDRFSISKGIRQGCCLSPTLFNLYIEYALREWKQAWRCKGIPVGNGQSIYTLQYADDQIILAESKQDMEKMLSELIEEYKKGGLVLNKDKTQYMCIGSTNTDLLLATGQTIRCCDEYDYLGNIITIDAEDKKSISRRIEKFKIWAKDMLHKWSPQEKSINEIIHEIYVTGRFRLTYGAEAWALTDDDKNELEEAEKEVLKDVANRNQVSFDTVSKKMNDKKELLEYIDNKQKKWNRKVNNMTDARLPKMVKSYN